MHVKYGEIDACGCAYEVTTEVLLKAYFAAGVGCDPRLSMATESLLSSSSDATSGAYICCDGNACFDEVKGLVRLLPNAALKVLSSNAASALAWCKGFCLDFAANARGTRRSASSSSAERSAGTSAYFEEDG